MILLSPGNASRPTIDKNRAKSAFPQRAIKRRFRLALKGCLPYIEGTCRAAGGREETEIIRETMS